MYTYGKFIQKLIISFFGYCVVLFYSVLGFSQCQSIVEFRLKNGGPEEDE